MSVILEAKPVVQAIENDLLEEVKNLQALGRIPTLGIIRVGEKPDDLYYENTILKKCQKLGINVQIYPLDRNVSLKEFENILRAVNCDSSVHGILIFRPLPEQLDENRIKDLIEPAKDIDCLHSLNLAKVWEGDTSGFVPCTPAAVMEILKYYQISLEGRNAVVIGRSMVVGKPLSMMLLKANATVTICHSKTRNLPQIARQADILVAALGKAKFIDHTYVTENSIVIDVGINDGGDGKICGDVDYEAVKDKVLSITPVPGGVGSVTTTILLKHVIMACKNTL
ncbi:MAG TPA: bifunctional 5,10-methylenetetrahydrofolate dehydrogenase/5,10-methenyltetrahydrofolate cyclohydrolase [Peptococcaceae bacterium]|nr:bifunctional 5,10-methylenetetrahydrofolate dehydrogenase/5,10-methenyltetrahydrofolate cyclohydrolase [Peptococcaceae bacterium]